MPDAVVEDLHAELLDDVAHDEVLHRAREARREGDTDGEGEQPQHARDELPLGARYLRERVAVDDLPEDDRVDEAEELRSAREDEREQDQPAVGLQVRPEDLHRDCG